MADGMGLREDICNVYGLWHGIAAGCGIRESSEHRASWRSQSD
jgi:hypothetical protein